MKQVVVLLTIVLVVVGLVILLKSFLPAKPSTNANSQNTIQGDQEKSNANLMKITSSAFKHNEKIPVKYTCDGENVNPPLEISDVPSNASTLALIMDDPDAPSGTWAHWLVWNIPPSASSIMENSVPESAMQGKTSFGNNRYGGPCPPSGAHRYFFKLYALDTKLRLPSYSEAKDLEQALQGHILRQAELVGVYGRNR